MSAFLLRFIAVAIWTPRRMWPQTLTAAEATVTLLEYADFLDWLSARSEGAKL